MCDYKKNKNAEYRNNKKDKKLQRNKSKFDKDNLLNNDCDLEEGYYENTLNKDNQKDKSETVESTQIESTQVESKDDNQYINKNNTQEYPEKTNDEEQDEEYNDAYFEPVVYKG